MEVKMRNLFKTEQKGRSMIEMLGVLAIIGVLSVGGISGYSKAMAKFKLTKAQDQISMLLINIRTAFSGSPSYEGLTNQTAVQLNIVPGDMLPGGIGNYSNVGTSDGILNAFGGNVKISNSGATNSGAYFIITYYGLGKETCTSLASSDWGSDGMVSIKVNNNTHTVGTDTLPISAITAVNECNQGGPGNTIEWTYY